MLHDALRRPPYPVGWLSRFVPALLVVVMGLVVAAAPTAASEPAPTKQAAKFEISFLQAMIDHHHMAVMMGEMCLEQAEHTELVAMCEDIIATQSAEIALMHQWLMDWYGVSHEPDMGGGMMHQMDRLMMLEGEQFEITFMQMMIRHHRGAIREAAQCLKQAYHEPLLDLCGQIITAQSAEIEQMQAWLCAWYGRCRGGTPA